MAKTTNKAVTFELDLRQSGIPRDGQKLAGILHHGDSCYVRGVYYLDTSTGDNQVGLRFDIVGATKDTYRTAVTAVETLFSDLYGNRIIQYEGMPEAQAVSKYLLGVMDERRNKRLAKLTAKETRAYPSAPRPYTVHLHMNGHHGGWLWAYPEGVPDRAAASRIGFNRKKAVMDFVYGEHANGVFAAAGKSALQKAWDKNETVMLEPKGYRQNQTNGPALKPVKVRDYLKEYASKASSPA